MLYLGPNPCLVFRKRARLPLGTFYTYSCAKQEHLLSSRLRRESLLPTPATLSGSGSICFGFCMRALFARLSFSG